MTLAKFKQLKIGQKVRFKKALLKFYIQDAFGMCTVRGAIIRESDARSYAARKMFGLGFKYAATYEGVKYAADYINTAYFTIDLGKGMVFTGYYNRKDIE